jgi:hypothetical protein
MTCDSGNRAILTKGGNGAQAYAMLETFVPRARSLRVGDYELRVAPLQTTIGQAKRLSPRRVTDEREGLMFTAVNLIVRC